ncbi:MAG TPA: hypothetical protein EYP17_11625 [Candidatus Latescibacteria bacterium]|nr:hypothetical protein [Candidatus Latescibacterota bacterium]
MGKVEEYLGLAAKAGKVAAGRTAVEKALWRGRGYLVLLTRECGRDVQRRFRGLAERFGVPVAPVDGDLGRAIGMPGKVVAVLTDPNLARQVLLNIDKDRLERAIPLATPD